MTPVLIIPPASLPVSLVQMKAHLRVDHGDEDATITDYIAAATGYLDGWHGVLGRAIMPQTWCVSVTGPGPHLLPMPDVTSVTATVGDDPVEVTQTLTASGVEIEVTGLARDTAAEVVFACAMPAAQLAVIGAAIRLLVGHWYAHREAVGGGNVATEMPMGVDMLVAALRWRRIA